MKLELRAIGTSTGVVLSKEMLTRLKVKRDDCLFAIETPAGYLLIPYDPEMEKQLGLGRAHMAKYRSVFRALARSGTADGQISSND
jgi:putative addiction module antidote